MHPYFRTKQNHRLVLIRSTDFVSAESKLKIIEQSIQVHSVLKASQWETETVRTLRRKNSFWDVSHMIMTRVATWSLLRDLVP